MSALFEILDDVTTERGDLTLRRRAVLSMSGKPVWEILIDGEFLMSSLVNDSERALATLGLAALEGGATRVLVGGLGLGITAYQALQAPIARLVVVELHAPVIDWHRRGLVPLGAELCGDDRCELRCADFFALMKEPGGDEQFDAILLDIDHSPRGLLKGSPAEFYARDGLRCILSHLAPGGVFAVWSADPADAEFVDELHAVFADVRTEDVAFENPLLDLEEHNTIYLARAPATPRD